jgi:hypothetical protein
MLKSSHRLSVSDAQRQELKQLNIYLAVVCDVPAGFDRARNAALYPTSRAA